MSNCVFIGRFQPVHNAHLLVIKGMTQVCDKVIVVIGSSKEQGTAKNPFSARERREMLQRSMQEADLIPKYDIYFVEVPDHNSDKEWIASIIKEVGEIDMVWTGNPNTEKCCTKAGIAVKIIKEVPGISGEIIRERIKKGEDWKILVPKSVANYISEIGGINRILNS